MADPGGPRSAARRKAPGQRRAWCCSLGGVELQSPERRTSLVQSKGPIHSSPSPSTKLGRTIIDPRRILSPGRVSPIDSLDPVPEIAAAAAAEPETPDPPPVERSLVPETAARVWAMEESLDLRLSLKAKDGGRLNLELDSEVLCEKSRFFAALVSGPRQMDNGEIEVGDIEDLDVFRETIELIYEKDFMRSIMRAGVSRAIDILEVSSTIAFDGGVASCLRYLEAVPWSESEEEKLKNLFASRTFDKDNSRDVLARLTGPQGTANSENLTTRLIESVTCGTNPSARKEMQSLVNGLLSKSSVYQKDPTGLNKESLYRILRSCLSSLTELFEEASSSSSSSSSTSSALRKGGESRPPVVERISKQAENLVWLLEILVEGQIGEEFVRLWGDQRVLISMHEVSSPMVRYELSRVSASVFVAMGNGRLQCRGPARLRVLSAWFGPMMVDFGWLRRCSKGLDPTAVEEGLGQALLTLPLDQQRLFFEEWFCSFAGKGRECPNLSKAFQVWWRRSFVRSPEGLRRSLT